MAKIRKRKIAVITGSRAEYGLLYWIIKGIQEDPALELKLIVSGTHLSREFGFTIKEITRNKIPIAKKVRMPLSSDTEEAIASAMGAGMTDFAASYKALKPDIILVLGDRFEIHAAVSAAMPFRIPVCHIHGGEATEGLMDELMRHAITKMSHIHFPSTEKYRKRIIQMGERPQNVHCFGSPAIDNISRLDLLDREGICKESGIPRDRKIGLVTYHPVTLEIGTSRKAITELLRAIGKTKDVFWIFTRTNADTSGRIIARHIKEFVKKHPQNTKLYLSLGQKNYLSLLKNAHLMVGNSSSGIIEAPSFRLPVVNIGDRQRGRISARNVIHVKICRKKEILKAIKKALSPAFCSSLKGLKNPYEKQDASERIVNKLKTYPLTERLLKKRFFEIKI